MKNIEHLACTEAHIRITFKKRHLVHTFEAHQIAELCSVRGSNFDMTMNTHSCLVQLYMKYMHLQ